MDKIKEKKRFSWQKILPWVVSIILVAFFLNYFYKNKDVSRLNVDTERITTDTIHQGVFQEFIPVSGVVLPIKTVVMGAIEGGRVEQKLVEDGAMVTAGQPILRLSNPDLEASYLNQEANIVAQINQIRNLSVLMEQQSLNLREAALNADYQIEVLGKRHKRNQKLYKDGVIPEAEYDLTIDELNYTRNRKELLDLTIEKDKASNLLQQEQMENSLNLMEKNLELSRRSLDNLTVKAPIDGQLSGLNSEIGEFITEGSQIAQLDDLSRFKIRVQVDEFYISRIFTGQSGSFEFAGRRYFLSIQKIYPQVVNGTFAADMIFTETTPTGIKRGQTVSVRLELSAQEEALLLAVGGFYQSTGGNWVYVIDPDGNTARRRDITLSRKNPNFYILESGLQEGEVVITSSYDNMGEKDELILK